MTNDRVILCGDANASHLPFAGTPLRLRVWGKDANVELQIEAVSAALAAPVPEALLDLVDIATYVYCADQAVTRGGSGVDDLGARWRRRLHFRIPVRVPELWASDSVQRTLTSTLGFLSDDEYSFEYFPLVGGRKSAQYLFGPDAAAADGVDDVVLFSGGLDSLGGSIQEAVKEGRRVALVTHQPSSKLVRRYRKLQAGLKAKAAHAPVFIPVTVNKLKSLGKEYTQRSRSFLYVALGASVAKALGRSRVRFYENGVISFNLPPSAQVVGAKATRTTHPKVLRGYAELLSLATGERFDVENPFIWRTKADVVRGIVEAGCASMIRFSTSCTHTWEMTRIHPHCGSCSQCIDRRFAVLAAGAENEDPAEGYKVQLLTDGRPPNETRTLLAAYVETAKDVARMPPLEFFAKFGEVSRVVRHLGGSADDAARRVYELHQRHARGVTDVMARAIEAHAREILNRTLPSTCLIRLVCDSAPVMASPAPPASRNVGAALSTRPLAENVFAKKGTQSWLVRFGGRRDFILHRSKGAAYLHILFSNQGQSVSVAKLASTVAAQPEEYMLGGSDESSDADALTAYKAQYEELLEERQQAIDDNDEAAKQRIQRDIDFIAAHVNADEGLGERRRRGPSAREKVRVRVANAIARAVDLIAREDGELAAHLKPPNLKRGMHPSYSPSNPVVWELS